MIDLFMVTIVFLTIFMFGVVIWSALQNRMQSVKRVMATAVRRHTREYELSLPTSWWYLLMNILSFGSRARRYYRDPNVPLLHGELSIAESVDYFMVFMAEGREVELCVPEDVYIDVLDGDRGILTYQGEIFKGFVKDKLQPDPHSQFDPNRTRQI
jgi:hypothetical protein